MAFQADFMKHRSVGWNETKSHMKRSKFESVTGQYFQWNCMPHRQIRHDVNKYSEA